MQEFSSSAELERVRGIAESARSAADRAQRQVNALDSEVARYERRGVRSFIAVLVLIGLTAGGALWFNSRLTEQETSIAKVVGAEGLDGLLQRLSGAETVLKTLPPRVEALDKTVNAVRESDSTASVELEKSIAQLNERIAALQAQHQEDGSQMASLRDELAAARRAQSQQAPPVARRPETISPAISPAMSQTDRDLRNFAVTMERANEVVPGVLLTIKETDVERQQVNGWLYLQEQHRFVPLTNQRLGQPVTVVDAENKQSHDIVFTRVRTNEASGYVSSPKAPVSVSAAN